MPAADWMPIPNRHGRLMARLRDQRRVDPYGGIGWDGLLEEREVLTREQLFEPLLGRAMIEDCTRAHGLSSGRYFVRATDFGLACLLLGYMPRGRVSEAQAQRWADEIPTLTPEALKENALAPDLKVKR